LLGCGKNFPSPALGRKESVQFADEPHRVDLAEQEAAVLRRQGDNRRVPDQGVDRCCGLPHEDVRRHLWVAGDRAPKGWIAFESE